MIRKERKARWTYECGYCQHTSSVSPDLFGALEAKQRHLRTIDHSLSVICDVFKPVMDLVKSVLGVVQQPQGGHPPLLLPNIPEFRLDSTPRRHSADAEHP